MDWPRLWRAVAGVYILALCDFSNAPPCYERQGVGGSPILPGAVVGGSIFVLFVDDDVAFADAAARSLEAVGMRTAVALGSAALDEFDSSAVDVVVTDIKLRAGVAHSVALERMIRSKSPRVPIILMTTYPELRRERSRTARRHAVQTWGTRGTPAARSKRDWRNNPASAGTHEDAVVLGRRFPRVRAGTANSRSQPERRAIWEAHIVGFFDRLWKAVSEIEFSDLPRPGADPDVRASAPRQPRRSYGCSARAGLARPRSSRLSLAIRARRLERGLSPAREPPPTTTSRPKRRCFGSSIREGWERRTTTPRRTLPGARASPTSCWS